jgi:hypothetical protein
MKELLDALYLRWQQAGIPNVISGGYFEGEVPERMVRPYAMVEAISENPGCNGLKRTNKREYLAARVDISVVSPQTFEELDGTDVAAVDAAVRYAAMSIPLPAIFIQLFPGVQTYVWEDKYHRAKLGFELWFSKPANYWRTLASLLTPQPPPPLQGTLLVCTAQSGFSSADQSSFPVGLVNVNQTTGVQTLLASNKLLVQPAYVTRLPGTNIVYIADLLAFRTGAIIRLDLDTGSQTAVAIGGLINGPEGVLCQNNALYVINVGNSSGQIHTLVRIDLASGQQSLVTDGMTSGGFLIAAGIAAGPGNTVYVGEKPANIAGGSDTGRLWQINTLTGQQTVVSSGGLFDHPSDIAVEFNGTILVGNAGDLTNNYTGSVIRIDPATGNQTLVTTFGPNSGLDSLAVGDDGTIYVGCVSTGTQPGTIYAVNAQTGVQRTVTSGGQLSLVEGMLVF